MRGSSFACAYFLQHSRDQISSAPYLDGLLLLAHRTQHCFDGKNDITGRIAIRNLGQRAQVEFVGQARAMRLQNAAPERQPGTIVGPWHHENLLKDGCQPFDVRLKGLIVSANDDDAVSRLEPLDRFRQLLLHSCAVGEVKLRNERKNGRVG
jgi:hypothetical protein